MLTNSRLIKHVGKFIPSATKPFFKKIMVIVRRIEVEWQSRNVQVNASPIFVLGNQKSGTSVIAALLAEITSQSVSVDLVKEYIYKKKSYPRVLNGEWSFSQLIDRNKLDFSRDIIKEANLTIFFKELESHFPQSSFVFVLRDPRDNIRSILNRIDIPGNLPDLNADMMKEVPIGWQMLLDGSWLGFKEDTYIGMLAARWNFMINIYLENKQKMHLIRYEDFMEDKIGEITRLTEKLGLTPVNDISSKIGIQYQPRGNREVDWHTFFGNENVKHIECICRNYMDQFGYSHRTSQLESNTEMTNGTND